MKSEQFASEIQSALPSVLTKDRFLRVALTTLQKTPKLQKCDEASLCQAMLDCASLGLDSACSLLGLRCEPMYAQGFQLQ